MVRWWQGKVNLETPMTRVLHHQPHPLLETQNRRGAGIGGSQFKSSFLAQPRVSDTTVPTPKAKVVGQVGLSPRVLDPPVVEEIDAFDDVTPQPCGNGNYLQYVAPA